VFIDQAFSYRLESAEFLPSIEWIDSLAHQRPELGAERQMVAGGWMMYGGPQSPANHIIGMGLGGPVSKEEIDCVEDFYRRRQSICEIVVSPYADMSLPTHLGERGYRITEWNSVLTRKLAPDDRFDSGGIDIREVRREEARQWAEILTRGFAEFPGVTPEMFMPMATAPNAMSFLAYIDGQPAGGAAGSVFPREGIAPLYGAATLPEFRNRGVQNALFQARLHKAAGAGCEWAVVCTQPGTVSQRNAERNGFQVAYTKVAMQREV
jgi:GNAT superfamily N-acetyltransferase